jgi:hypothetical protein
MAVLTPVHPDHARPAITFFSNARPVTPAKRSPKMCGQAFICPADKTADQIDEHRIAYDERSALRFDLGCKIIFGSPLSMDCDEHTVKCVKNMPIRQEEPIRKGADPLRRGRKTNEVDSPPRGQPPFSDRKKSMPWPLNKSPQRIRFAG